MHERAKEEAVLTRGGSEDVSPETSAQLHRDADLLLDVVRGAVESTTQRKILYGSTIDPQTAGLFVSLLSRYQPDDRNRLLFLIQNNADLAHFAPLQEMVHHGGPEVLRLIRACRDYSTFQVQKGAIDVTDEEQAHHAMLAGLHLAPGAPLAFAAGFFHGLGNIPVVGGVFERVGDGVASLSLDVDSAMGADMELAKVSVQVGDVFGRAEAHLAEIWAGGELETFEAAETAYDAASTGRQVVELIKDVEDELEDLDAVWTVASKVINDLAAAVYDLSSYAMSHDPQALDEGIDHLDQALDQCVIELRDRAKAGLTEAGAVEYNEKRDAIVFNHEHRNVSQTEARPAEWQPHLDTMRAATVELLSTKDPAARQAAQQKLKAAGDAMRNLEPAFADPRIARNQELVDEQKADKKAREDKKREDAAQRITSTANARYLAGKVRQTLTGALLDGLADALEELHQRLAGEVKTWVGDPSKTPEEKESLLRAVLTAGLGGAVSGAILEKLKKGLKGEIEKAIAHILDKKLGGLGDGAAKLVDPHIDALLAYLEKQLDVEEGIHRLFEPVVEKILGDGGEAEGGGGEKKGEGEPKPHDPAID